MLCKDGADLLGDRLVDLEARLDKDQIWTLPLRGDRRHRRAHTELARLIACRRDDAALPRSTHGDRLAAQFRVVALFDRRVERIHVDVDDLPAARRTDRGLIRHWAFPDHPRPRSRLPGERRPEAAAAASSPRPTE